jgi:hypothetical protein
MLFFGGISALIAISSIARGDFAGALFLVAPAAVIRIRLMRTWTSGDQLIDRGIVRATRVRQSYIARFTVQDVENQVALFGAQRRRVVFLERTDARRIRLNSTDNRFVRGMGIRRAPSDADELCADLNDWLNPRQ